MVFFLWQRAFSLEPTCGVLFLFGGFLFAFFSPSPPPGPLDFKDQIPAYTQNCGADSHCSPEEAVGSEALSPTQMELPAVFFWPGSEELHRKRRDSENLLQTHTSWHRCSYQPVGVTGSGELSQVSFVELERHCGHGLHLHMNLLHNPDVIQWYILGLRIWI